MNIEEISKTINYLLDNNLQLVEKGLDKISINIEGPCGIGKTSIIKQIAEERGADYVKICLSELEEVGDLVGIGSKYYTVTKDNEELQVAEKVLDRYIAMGWELCPYCDPVMKYAVPSWVPTDPNKEIILTLDDAFRASSLFLQATMSLVQFGEYVSWKLPKKCHLILTNNPDNGTYWVSSADPAMMSRMLTFKVDFDVFAFAKWMDKVGIRGELINFALLSPEIFDRSEHINARTYTMFANALTGIKDLSTPESLAFVSNIAEGCFNDDVVPGMFATFVHNKLDKLISSEEILKGSWEEVKKQLKELLYQEENYRSDIASVITFRFINYLDRYFSDADTDPKSSKSAKVIDRITELVTSEELLLTEDLMFNMVKKASAKYPTRFAKLMMNPKIREKILG